MKKRIWSVVLAVSILIGTVEVPMSSVMASEDIQYQIEAVEDNETVEEVVGDRNESFDEEEMVLKEEDKDEDIATMATGLQKIDYVERAKNNRVYQQEKNGCSITAMSCVEGYVANTGISESEHKAIYNEVKRKNGNGLSANWSSLGYKVADNVTYQTLYDKLLLGNPVIVRKYKKWINSQGEEQVSSHYAVVVGFEDKDHNFKPEVKEFIVMETEKYLKVYYKEHNSDATKGYPESWDNDYDSATRVPLNEWVNYGSHQMTQIVYRTTGMNLTSLKDEPASAFVITSTKPEGNKIKGNAFSIHGSAESNRKIKSIRAGVYQGNNPMFIYTEDNINRYHYSWGSGGDLDDAMKFKSLKEGEYRFELVVTDESEATKSVTSNFTVGAKQNQNNVAKPTIAISSEYTTLGKTSAKRTALLKNPAGAIVGECGMILYDRNKNPIARCSENINNYEKRNIYLMLQIRQVIRI